MNTVLTKTYEPPEINRSEILRYAGCDKDFQLDLIDECLSELKNKLSYKVCFVEFEISENDKFSDLGFVKTASSDLRKNLDGCRKIILFAATIGIEIDRLIAKYNRISPSKALIFQAIGAERIESLCDVFCNEVKEKYEIKPRYSPGYGDLSLEIQKKIFDVLDCPRKIGLTLNDSLLMSPSKSVTAIIGVKV
ncbi:MAG: Vitamin B12 dependent methionine synthase activation subunit [Ruminococcus sp.]|nr:Vitamin B12 dependent methionine synthase activation subunit [Candidatus Copronaster equi]